jgi:AcrR family transcriptional regulator
VYLSVVIIVGNLSQNSQNVDVTSGSDGRRQRTQRTRQAIIDAARSMVAEGILVPTAQQISDRAGIGIRSFFRHFLDMESLFLAADEQSRKGMEALFIGIDRSGALKERIQHVVECRAEGYDTHANDICAAKANGWRWDLLHKNYQRYQRRLRKDLDDWLPELKTLPQAERDAVDAIASGEMWLRLRDQQELSKQRSIAVVVNLLVGLIPNA